jgi:hypothetical protein
MPVWLNNRPFIHFLKPSAMKNKTSLSLIFFLILACFQAGYSQNGRFDVNFGVGIFPTFAKDKIKTILPPLALSCDFKAMPNLSVGLYAGHSESVKKYKVGNDGTVAQSRNRFSIVGLRAAAHYRELENWDFYGGMTLNYNHSRVEILEGDKDFITRHMGIKPVSGKMSASGFVGARYGLGKNLGIFAEIGMGISIVAVGVGYRFND